MSQPYLGTSDVNRVSWAVASTCKNPEKALEFLNLTYTDKDVINLIIYGIEGKDYVKVSDNVVKYPDGQDARLFHIQPSLAAAYAEASLTSISWKVPAKIHRKL